MAYRTPDFEKIRTGWLNDIKNQCPDADITSDSDNFVRASATASVADNLYRDQAWIVRQIFPDTADSDYLELHAKTRNITRKNATFATGLASITGTPETEIPTGQAIKRDNVTYITTESVIISAAGVIDVPIKAVNAGVAANCETEQFAELASPPIGIDSLIKLSPTFGGTDAESDASLLARYLEILRRPPAGGNQYDYKRWALEVEGVSGAYVYPLRRGLGTVDIAITSANNLPSQTLMKAVSDHINEVRPVTAKNHLIFAPTPKNIHFDIIVELSGITLPDAQSQVIQVIHDYMQTLSPGEPFIKSQLELQISIIPGISDRSIVSPAFNIKPIVNADIVEWLRVGSVNVRL